MLVEKITSRQNPLVKRFRRVRAMGERQHVFLEGVRLIEDAIHTGAHFESVAFTGELESSERGAALLESLRRVQCRGALVSKQVMETIAGTKTPQGVAALVSRPYLGLDDLFSNSPDLLVVADELQDPGNLGTIIRTAEAAGANGVITTRYTVDPFNEKAIRASMGSALRLPIVTGASRADIVARCRDHKIKMIASRSKPGPSQGVIEDAARAERIKLCMEVDMTVPVALIVGREATGIPVSAQEDADEFVHIPMAQNVESLNVATATAILLYEADRQRGFRFSKV
ncbi:MAG TPA: RNA methyltransferase [Blastocatellia bacterium]|nr:RNA methyltransferase [Blastocatellia bacterium]